MRISISLRPTPVLIALALASPWLGGCGPDKTAGTRVGQVDDRDRNPRQSHNDRLAAEAARLTRIASAR